MQLGELGAVALCGFGGYLLVSWWLGHSEKTRTSQERLRDASLRGAFRDSCREAPQNDAVLREAPPLESERRNAKFDARKDVRKAVAVGGVSFEVRTDDGQSKLLIKSVADDTPAVEFIAESLQHGWDSGVLAIRVSVSVVIPHRAAPLRLRLFDSFGKELPGALWPQDAIAPS